MRSCKVLACPPDPAKPVGVDRRRAWPAEGVDMHLYGKEYSIFLRDPAPLFNPTNEITLCQGIQSAQVNGDGTMIALLFILIQSRSLSGTPSQKASASNL